MVNEEILTALKNAVDHGESVEAAVNSMIGSGYNPNEVQEAANLVGYGTMNYLQPKPEESLAMPSQKNIFGRPVQRQIPPKQPMQKPFQQPPQQPQFQTIKNQRYSIQQNPSAIKQNIDSGTIMPSSQQQVPIQSAKPQYSQPPINPQPTQDFNPAPTNPKPQLQSQPQPISLIPPKKTYTKEIILVLVLLILVGVLIGTIVFKDKILNLIQGIKS